MGTSEIGDHFIGEDFERTPNREHADELTLSRFHRSPFGAINQDTASKYVAAWKSYKPDGEFDQIFRDAILGGEIDAVFAAKAYILRVGRLPDDPNAVIGVAPREAS